jgi:hypothetical protein
MRPQLTGPMKRSGLTSRTASSPVKRRSTPPAVAGIDRRHRRGASDFQNGVAVKLSRHHVRPPGAAIGADHLGRLASQRGPSNRMHGARAILPNGARAILPNGARTILPNGAWTILTHGAWTILPNGGRAILRNGAWRILTQRGLHNPTQRAQAIGMHGPEQSYATGPGLSLPTGPGQSYPTGPE